MLRLLRLLLMMVADLMRPRARLVAENLALRQQLAVLTANQPRLQLTRWDRVFWVALRRLWSGWRSVLRIVRPETVIGWHRQGFKLFWRWKSRRSRGRPRIDPELRALIRRMALENVTWGAPRIHAELLKLGFDVSERTVSRYMPKRPPRSKTQGWKSFRRNHAVGTHAMDFFVVHTAFFRPLWVWFVIEHHSRKIVSLRVTERPSSRAVKLWLYDAYAFGEGAPERMIFDRDGIFGLVHKPGNE